MTRFGTVLVLTTGMWLGLGCDRPSAGSPGGGPQVAATPGSAAAPVAAPSNAVPVIPGWPPTKAQPRLPTLKLFVGPETITAEVALTRLQLATGMMFRKEMPEMEGMLFFLGVPQRASFYMRNTTVPLTAAYIDGEGTILELHDLKPLEETPVPAQADNIEFVLEMNQGWFTRHTVAPGVNIGTENGPLKQAFRFAK